MRVPSSLPAPALALAALLSCLTATRGHAQVDQRALDQLGPAPGAAGAAPRPATRPQPGHAHPNGPHQTLPPLKAAPVKPPAATVSPTAPPAPVLPPPIVVPTRPPPPPTPAAITADAPNVATTLAGGLRITFGDDRADFNPAADAALRALAHGPPEANYTVAAYAAGSPDDPSTPRRVSLSRALAVRAVLMAEGVASARIYVRALGASMPAIADGPPDRVDITVAGPPAPSQKAAP